MISKLEKIKEALKLASECHEASFDVVFAAKNGLAELNEVMERLNSEELVIEVEKHLYKIAPLTFKQFAQAALNIIRGKDND